LDTNLENMTGKTFGGLVSPELTRCLSDAGIITPTAVQAEAIPYLTQGRDIIASSPTGTGKTLAYLLPIFARLNPAVKQPQALVLTPTRELAAQVHREAQRLGHALGETAGAALLIGGASLERQLERLKTKPRVIVGSAGRILELIEMKKLTLHYVKTIVLDEGDRLLDAQNISSVVRVINCTLRDRQLAFFSATVGGEALRKAKELMKEPVSLLLSQRQPHTVGPRTDDARSDDVRSDDIRSDDVRSELPENIEHIYFVCEKRDKLETLRKIVHAEKITRGLVFINDENALDILVKRLNYHGIPAVGLSGKTLKNDRRLALDALRQGRAVLLAASDLASRGLDIPGITHVFCLDCPDDPEIYLHRAGRCGRMGARGVAVSILTERETPQLLRAARKLGVSVGRGKVSRGKIEIAK
jgi:superfamily II DNA/RNA helicase